MAADEQLTKLKTLVQENCYVLVGRS